MNPKVTRSKSDRAFYLALLTAALGYFVDVYDIILFTAVRVPSLKDLGLSGDALTQTGLTLLNFQLVGMVIGGFLWGTLGDRRGRVSVLFGSIILYSVANLLNATATSVGFYALCRFLAGVGLAGEMGAGVTLVSEMMSRENRGYGTMLIATCGVLGGITGGILGDRVPWRWAFALGGSLGFGLLLLRWSVSESTLFSRLRKSSIPRGDLTALFRSRELFLRYVKCLCLGAPVWLCVGIFITLSPEIGKVLGFSAPLSAGKAIIFYNIGFGLGDVGSSLLSQLWQSRKKALASFLGLTLVGMLSFLSRDGTTPDFFYFACVLLGAGAGYWAVFIMVSTEQFGTNLRATVTTSLPNLVRGLGVPISILIQWMIPQLGLLLSLKLVGLSALTLATFCLLTLKETYGLDLDFVENIPNH